MKQEKIAIVGTGMIGISLATMFTGNGYETFVLAINEEMMELGLASYDEMYQNLIKKELVTHKQYERCKELLHLTLNYQDLSDVDVVFESVIEDVDVKTAVYNEIFSNCPKCQVIASTTSALSPETLISDLESNREKVIVAHPFNPPHLVPFFEMIKGPETSEDAVKIVYDVLESCGRKVSIGKKSAPGFIANRLQHALLREAIYMVEQGISDPRDIDKALKYSFMPRYTSVGLFEHQDAAGLDLVHNIEKYLLPDLSTEQGVPELISQKVAAGNLGQKTGEGIYKWDEESKADFKRRAAEPYWQYFNWDLPSI